MENLSIKCFQWNVLSYWGSMAIWTVEHVSSLPSICPVRRSLLPLRRDVGARWVRTPLPASVSPLTCLCVSGPWDAGTFWAFTLQSAMPSQAPCTCPLPDHHLWLLSDLSSHIPPEIGAGLPLLGSHHFKSHCYDLFHVCPCCQGRAARRQGQGLPCSHLELHELVQSPEHAENQDTCLGEGRKGGWMVIKVGLRDLWRKSHLIVLKYPWPLSCN